MVTMAKKVAAAAAVGVFAIGITIGTAFALSDLGNQPPASAIVMNAGLQWVWASPCEGIPDELCGGVGGNLGVLLHHGFHFASVAEWGTWASLTDFQTAFAGVTCASPEFSKSFDHCDPGEFAAGFVWNSPLTTPGQAANALSETFLVADIVPEPASLVLLGLGLAGLAGLSWKQRRNV